MSAQGDSRAGTLAKAIIAVALVGITTFALVLGDWLPPQARYWLLAIRGRGTNLALAQAELNAAADAFGATTWYFAQGEAIPDAHHTWVLLANPGAVAANATVAFHPLSGETKTVQVPVPALGRAAVYANQYVGGLFSTTVTSSLPLVAEQSVFFANDAYTVPGVATPSTVWYLPEGFVGGAYDTGVHVFNPGTVAATVALTFYGDAGQTQTVSRDVAPRSTLRLVLAQECTIQGAVATRVEATAPVVVQRTTYFPGRDDGRGGHATTGGSLLSEAWYFPLARTGDTYDTWMMLLNPGDAPISVQARYLTAGATRTATYTLAPRARTTVWLDKEAVEGRAPAGDFGVLLLADGSFAAESVIYQSGAGSYITGSAAAAAPAAARLWYFAEGSTAAPYTTELALLNPGPTGAMVRASFMPAPPGSTAPGWALLPGELKVVSLNEVLSSAAAGVAVSSDVPVLAFRLMTMAGSGLFGALGLPVNLPPARPVAFIPVVKAPPAPLPTPTATPVPGVTVTPTRIRPADASAYALEGPITGTANCGTTGIKGRITDENGLPLPGLRVRVWADGWGGAFSNPTAADGAWDVFLGIGARPGTWHAAVVDDGGALLSPVVSLPTSDDCRNGYQWLEVQWRRRGEAAQDYELAWARRLTCQENNGNHHLFIDVTDAAGRGLPDVTVRVTWAGGQEDVVTGRKLDVGPGRVEFPMYKGTYAVQVLGGTSDRATDLTVELPDETQCTNMGNTLYHYSYHVVFRRR